ncbi:MAG: response regulator transcription factor [Bacteroidota bacterium]
MKLLLVEDNKELSKDITEYPSNHDFIFETAYDFTSAEEKIMLYRYDLVILDIGLPDGNGLDLLQKIRESHPETAVIILTARHALKFKLSGLEQGADDYLTKPFHNAELNARIRSILRRKFVNSRENIIRLHEISIDIAAAEVKVNQTTLNLTRMEYHLLLYFVYNKNHLLTRESIAEHLWGDHADQADNFDFVYNHIKNLRRKITKAGGRDYLKSMYGMGYKLDTKI